MEHSMQGRKERVRELERSVKKTFLLSVAAVLLLVITVVLALRHFHRLGM
jgi:hypothetical protein